ncbi:MAG: DNA polymerase I [Lachnospiraceae bacterium]|nr:DNA polymerase I [Lachnospiraceae bacterium]
MKKILLMDGHSILNRAFYGLPDLTNSKGLHTNAVYGFLNIMFRIIEEEQPDGIAVAFDVKHPTFRHEMFKEYKGTRKPMPAELHEQVPVMKDVLKVMNIAVIERPGYEADDILGTLAGICEREGMNVTILSGDRDLLQLVTDRVTLRIPKTKFGKTIIEDYNPSTVEEVYSLTPSQIVDLKGLMGDSSDNIPGLPGVGEKTATKLLLQYKTVEEVISHKEEITPNKAKNAVMEHSDLAILSKKLATIKTDCELDIDISNIAINEMFNEESYKLIKELEFKSLYSKFEGTTGANASPNTVEYTIVTDYSVMMDYCERLTQTVTGQTADSAKQGSVVTFDMMINEAGNRVETVTWQTASDNPTVFVVGGNDYDEKLRLIDETVFRLLDESHASGPVTFVAHGVKDYLKYINIQYADNLWDTHIAAYLLNPLKDSYMHEDIARDYLGMQIQTWQERYGKKKLGQVVEEDSEDFYEYAAIRCNVISKSYTNIADELKASGMDRLYRDIEMPLIFTLHNMEVIGIRADKEALREYGDSLTSRIDELEKMIYGFAGEEFNINSPKQLGVILFEKMKLPFAKKTKTGYSTSADILEKLRFEDPIVPAVLEYRQLTKLKSTYADGLAAYISEDGRIHGKFNQTITATGRISSTEPNLQNIPIRIELGRQIRKVFVPREGCIFLDADYSQIELRVLAHMSGDEELINAYNEDMDIHSITASKVFHVPIEEVDSSLRRKAKAVNFGIVYGISSFGLGQDLGIGRKEAEEYIARYFETYQGVKAFLDSLVADAKDTGYSYTLYGRRRPIPELKQSNFMQRSFGERVAMNAPIQGTAADIMKVAMINVEKRLKKEGLESRLILQVHDELMLEVPLAEEEKAAKILREEMMNAAGLKVQLIVEVERGNDWYEAK